MVWEIINGIPLDAIESIIREFLADRPEVAVDDIAGIAERIGLHTMSLAIALSGLVRKGLVRRNDDQPASNQMTRTWQQAPRQQQYTFSVGDYQALVWHQTTGEWAALISRNHTAINNDLFATLKGAQVWCEDRLADLQAQGKS